MEALIFLVPLSILVSLLIISVGFWANRSGQYDQTDSDVSRALSNEDLIQRNEGEDKSTVR